MANVASHFRVGNVFYSGELDDYNETFQGWLTTRNATQLLQNRQYRTWGLNRPLGTCGDARLYLLAANVRGGHGSVEKNARSAVLLVTLHEVEALLTADANEFTNEFLLENYSFGNLELSSAEHHGSDSHGSNAPHFLTATKPNAVVISVGIIPSNYAIPKRQTLDRLAQPTLHEFPTHACQYFEHEQPRLVWTDRWVFETATNGCVGFETAGQDGVFNIQIQQSQPQD